MSNYKDLEKKKATTGAWHAAHRERENARSRAWKAAHPEKHKANTKAWQVRNGDKMTAHQRKRRACKLHAPVNDFTRAQWEMLKAQFKWSCAYCGIKPKRLTVDHLTPLTKGGSHTLSNIVPACHVCNSKKGDRGPLRPVQPLLC